ncbi:unnamed protein product [Urochloa humidicola]
MGSRAAACAQRRMLWLVTAAALLECAHENILPAMFREVGAALGASPSALGSITLCRALAQALCYPLAACAASRLHRARVVAAGTFLCAAAAALAGASATVLGMAVFAGIAVPVTICCLTYTAVYWTYPADRQHARMMAAVTAAQQEAFVDDRKNCGCEASGPAADYGLNQALLSVANDKVES